MVDVISYVGDDQQRELELMDIANDQNAVRVTVMRGTQVNANPGFDNEVAGLEYSHSLYARIDIYKRNSPDFVGLTDNADVKLRDFWYFLDPRYGMKRMMVSYIVKEGKMTQVQLKDNAD